MCTHLGKVESIAPRAASIFEDRLRSAVACNQPPGIAAARAGDAVEALQLRSRVLREGSIMEFSLASIAIRIGHRPGSLHRATVSAGGVRRQRHSVSAGHAERHDLYGDE